MKKIAMITDGWKRLITYAWVDGIMRRIRELNEDVCIYQYNCYGNWSRDKKHNMGEYNIYNLPDLNEFDGVILDCNNIVDREQMQKVTELLRQVSVPVVSIDYAIDGFYYVGIDNITPMKEMMEHLHKVHGCESFLFAGGPKGNYENYSRMKAFKESIERFGLDASKSRVWYGDYDYNTGVAYMEELEEDGKTFPQAIVCANDNIAAGICRRAEDFGYKVPQDFIVTGFDNLDKAAYFHPQITTIGNNRGKIGAKVLDVFEELWKGNKLETFQFVPTQCVFGESCGCKNTGAVDYREHIKEQMIYTIKEQANDERRVALEDRMADCEEFADIFRELTEFLSELDCDAFHIVVDKRIYAAEDLAEFPKEGYAKGYLVYGYGMEDGKQLSFRSVEDLEAHLKEDGHQNAYMYTPIHFREYAIGYTIVKNARFLYENPYFYDIHSVFMRAMERLYKQRQLEKINRRLEELYNRDPLTGVYNRIAYSEMIEPKFAEYHKNDVACCLAFLDADKVKEINDNLGHEYGDDLIKRVAKILKKHCPEDGYVYRFGGDEFVVFFPYATKEKAESFKQEFLEEIRQHDISVSIGVVVTNPKRQKTLDEYLTMADEKMYQMKQENRK